MAQSSLGPYFVNHHFSKSPTCLILYNSFFRGDKPSTLKVVEIEENLQNHHLHHDPLMTIDFGFLPETLMNLVGFANGLVCVRQYNDKDRIFICNPITREYILLPYPKYIRKNHYSIVIYGFALCPVTKNCKVVRAFERKNQHIHSDTSMSDLIDMEVEVYTLGTETWRNVGVFPYEIYGRQTSQSLNGRLHWLISLGDGPEMICSFDIEKEVFELVFSTPPYIVDDQTRTLGVLGGCLCLCDNSPESQIVVWVMKDYGVKESSWTKQIFIQHSNITYPDFMPIEPVYVVKLMEDGSVLMLYLGDFLFTYHPGTKTYEQLDFISEPDFEVTTYAPSFLSLANFVPADNVFQF